MINRYDGNYVKGYIREIADGLLHMVVTDKADDVISPDEGIDLWARISEEKKRNGGIFFFVGNGASATMAEHLSHDCFQNADFLTETVSETSHITAVGNDYSYEEVFSYRIGKMLSGKDMLITISSSGNSPNIVKAIESARKKGVYVVTLSGKREDNNSRRMGDLNFYVPLNTYGLVESAHAALLHCWLDRYLDQYRGGRH